MEKIDFKSLAREMSGKQTFTGSAILITIFSLVSLFFIWASLAELDNVTRGEGKIVSAVQNQLVQAAEGGVILNRYVAENSVVARGDILFELDPIDASSELNRVNQRLTALNIKEQRLRAEISGDDWQLDDTTSAASSMIALSESSLFAARQADLRGTISVLNEQLRQRQQSLNAASARAETARRTAEFLQQEIEVVEPLVRENIAPATRLLELQRQLENANGEVEQAQSQAEQARSGILELETEIENTYANFRLRSLDELNTLIAEQSELREQLPRLEERVSRTTIRAPMDGIISRLNYRTPGGFVGVGDVLLELVPTGEDLIIEAKIKPQDISRILVGDTVRIRLSAYDSQRFGTLDGSVIDISPDAVQSDTPGAGSYYLVYVQILSDLILEATGEPVTLLPGMTATVDVLSGKRTVLDYLVRPIARVQELALRD